jgi:hypothetical protein
MREQPARRGGCSPSRLFTAAAERLIGIGWKHYQAVRAGRSRADVAVDIEIEMRIESDSLWLDFDHVNLMIAIRLNHFPPAQGLQPEKSDTTNRCSS